MCVSRQPGYDGGDCCECTCVSTDEYTCGDDNHGGFACVDPGASCVQDDDYEAHNESQGSFSYSPCIEDNISDGDCDNTNNVEECGKVFPIKVLFDPS